MTHRLILRPAARRDLAEIWTFTADRWSVSQANRYLAGLQEVFNLICQSPEIARSSRLFNRPVRLHPYRSHLVIFAADDAVIDVIRVVHARSNWQALSLNGDA